jgi:hypothetical protein
MYTVSEDRPRGTSAGQSSREFPVLFHLMDVSRPRAKLSPTIDSSNLLNAVEQLHWPPDEDSEPLPSASSAPEPAATRNELPPAIESPPVIEIPTAAPETTVAASELAATTTDDVIATETPAAEVASVEVTADIAEAPRPALPSPALVTLRKKPKTSASEDWFASHGKYIAVAFVLALVATIYFARVNREQNSVAKLDTPSQPPLIDSTPAVAATSQPAYSSPPIAPTVQTASAASPATPSPVELRAPQLVEPSSDRPKDNLFEFAAAKGADDRIAARTDDPSKSTAPALAAPALTSPTQPGTPEVVATPAPQVAAPAEAAAYPVTSSPATHYPVSIPAGAAYPATSPPQPSAPILAPPGGNGYQPQSQYGPPGGGVYQSQSQYGAPAGPPTDYRSQYPVTPASLPPQQPAAQAWNGGQPASYPSYDTTARGPRNERTGSGNY